MPVDTLYLETPLSSPVQKNPSISHTNWVFPPNLLIPVIMSIISQYLYSECFTMCSYARYLKWFFLLCEINKHHNHILLKMRNLRIERLYDMCTVSSITESCTYAFWPQIQHSFPKLTPIKTILLASNPCFGTFFFSLIFSDLFNIHYTSM